MFCFERDTEKIKSAKPFILLAFMFVISTTINAQFTITPDTFACKGSSINLNAYVNGAINTTHYTSSSTSYHWDTLQTYTALDTMKDDDVRGPIDIGFSFSFLCGDYTKLYIASNGLVSFGDSNDVSWVVRTIPNKNWDIPKNVIMGPWEDWDPALGGQIIYGVKGTAPYRRMVISWINVPMYSCPSLTGTFQIVIEETTNLIQNNIYNKPGNAGCNALTGINATQGILNSDGSVAFVKTGRNATLWSTYYESTKFTPDVDSMNIVWSYIDVLTGYSQKWYGKTISVKPDSTIYYNAFLTKCSGDIINTRVKVTVIPGLTSSLKNADTLICKGQPVNLTATASGGLPSLYRYHWLYDNEVTVTPNYTTRPDSTVNYKLVVTDNCSVPDTNSVNINVLPPLQLKIFADTTICYGTNVLLNPVKSGGLSTSSFISWGLDTASNKYLAPIQDTLVQMVLSDNCTIKSDTAWTDIRVRKPLQIKINNDTTLCFGDTLKLVSNYSGGDSSHYKFTWNQGIGNVPSINFVPDSSKTYNVILTDGCTPKSSSDSAYVRVRRAPHLLIRQDSTICNGQSILLYALPINGDTDGVTFTWNNNIGINNFFNISPTTTILFKVNLNDKCLLNPLNDSVLIQVRPPLNVNVADTLICYGNEINLIANATGGNQSMYSFQWNTGNSGDTLINISPKQKTTYWVKLADNCTKIPDSTSVTVNVLSPLNVKLPSDTLLCAGYNLLINARAIGGKGIYNYIWNGNVTSNSYLPLNSINDSTIILKLTDGCSLPAFDTMNIHRQPIPFADFSFNQLSNCGTEKMQFESNSKYVNGSHFQWNFGDGNFSTDSDLVHTFNFSGKYSVSLAITSKIGCFDSISKAINFTIRQAAAADFTATTFDVDISKPDIKFTSLSSDSLKHLWIFGNTGYTSDSINPEFTFNQTGSYLITLIVKNADGCSDSTSKWLTVSSIYTLFIPNAITPNNDGKNDVFIPVGRGIKEFSMFIFDRNSNLIYQSNDIQNAWNGRVQNGNDFPLSDVVFYQINTKDINDQFHQYTGTITLVK